MKDKTISYVNLADIRRNCSTKIVAFVSGTFDLLHPGHKHFFELAKDVTRADVLVVGVGSDIDIKRYKGDARPIIEEEARLKLVAALEAVDYAFITHALPEGQGHFLDGFINIFEKLQPDYYVVNEGTFDMEYRHALAERHGVAIKVLRHGVTCPARGYSTTAIIQRIIDATPR